MNINFVRSLVNTFSCVSPRIHRNNLFESFFPARTTNFFPREEISSGLKVRCFTIDSTLRANKQVENVVKSEDIKVDSGEKSNKQVENVKSEDIKVDSGEKVTLVFKDSKENTFEIKGEVGKTVFEAAKEYGIALEGSCNGQRACSTCHVYVDEESLKLLEEASVEEDDLLDKASFTNANSRLACQLTVTKDLEGRTFTLPIGTRNFYVDGHKPEPH